MDTSKEYIKMCEKAEEIQKLRIYVKMVLSGDWFFAKNDLKYDEVFPVVDGGEFYGTKKWVKSYQAGWECENDLEFLEYPYIWLPRQDQMQEMVIETQFNKTIDGVVIDLVGQMTLFCFSYGEIRDPSKEYVKQFSSMEQLWLAFVMKEKYNKIWNGEIWTSTPPSSQA